ncbi:ribosome-binding factor A [Tessaracoccus bendigoensis DSM 12906]|uniref:Ribosome-binding factor A n=1 Tax=Tessaracoccus bendigoensis DSM 12906 TaxID=1123357 RepID=A0A1M6INA4_9ACTN|nr:30S ribosome-binding factor RbfA [Tessaracoccus bendigoensis]SHJ35951.1 ribosome-binding factor A [Tessaracoccus bendigoensis DSM 12906]
MVGPRNAKLADQIQVILASTIQSKIKDPRLGFVTITEVRLTGDNREATAFYTVLGDDESRKASAAALESATGLLRTTVGQQLGLKFTPTLTFVLDATSDVARHMEDLLAQVQATDAASAAASEGKSFAGDADPYRKPREAEDEAK